MLFYQPEIGNGNLFLDEDESRHAVKVLRLTQGHPIQLTDGAGHLYEAVITDAKHKKCLFEILRTTDIPRRPFEVRIGIAPTKNIDRVEWFIEKAVEIGIGQIHFMACRNSERKVMNPDRLIKKAISAMKQSQQAWLPAIHPMDDFETVVKKQSGVLQKFIAHVDLHNPTQLKDVARKGEQYITLIGPEGDFSDYEVETALSAGFTKVSLGPNRLRTETAGIVACHTLNLING